MDQRCSGNFIGAGAQLGIFAYLYATTRHSLHSLMKVAERSSGVDAAKINLELIEFQ